MHTYCEYTYVFVYAMYREYYLSSKICARFNSAK